MTCWLYGHTLHLIFIRTELDFGCFPIHASIFLRPQNQLRGIKSTGVNGFHTYMAIYIFILYPAFLGWLNPTQEGF